MQSASRLFILAMVVGNWAAGQETLRLRPRYTLRPGDVLELQYRYTPALNQTVTVLPDGDVNLNLVGDVKVSELTVAQARELIVERAKSRLNDP